MQATKKAILTFLLLEVLLPEINSTNILVARSKRARHSYDGDLEKMNTNKYSLEAVIDKFEEVVGGLKGALEEINKAVGTAKAAIFDEAHNSFRQFWRSFNPAIFPGTYWCGAGNASKDYDSVGFFGEADKCCRVHDQCTVTIPVGKIKYGLKNDTPYTASTCDCDDQFYSCLKRVNTTVSSKIGITYFNILQIQCFKYDHPLACTVKGTSQRCAKHDYDRNSPMIWQWKKAKRF